MNISATKKSQLYLNSFTLIVIVNSLNVDGVLAFVGTVTDDLQVNLLRKLFPLDGVAADLVKVAKNNEIGQRLVTSTIDD